MIEDSHNGIRAAYAAGMHPIMVPDLMEVTEEMKSSQKRFWDRFAQCRNFCRGQAYKFICFYECQ